MLHPSYSDLLNVVNSDVEPGEHPIIQSRYSIVIATAKRARQLIAGEEPLVETDSNKPLSIAVEELAERKVKIVSEDDSPEDEIPEDEIVETVDTEVLVCGAGTSGLFAACAAAEEGAKVVCLEKGAIGGGVRDNLGSINSRLQREAGCEIDENEICNDLVRYANGYCNPRLYHLCAQNSGEAIDWYQDRLE